MPEDGGGVEVWGVGLQGGEEGRADVAVGLRGGEREDDLAEREAGRGGLTPTMAMFLRSIDCGRWRRGVSYGVCELVFLVLR